MLRTFGIVVALAAVASADDGQAAASSFQSHPPVRPLPLPSSRPMAEGPARFVDSSRGDDANDGSEQRPWKTVRHAVGRIEPGQTLYLRGGTYYELVTVQTSGLPERPITIRAYPGELAVIDGGFPEFFVDPAAAWTPDPARPGEFLSHRTYPELNSPAARTNPPGVILLGSFGDSMLPLHGYRYGTDLASTNEFWNIDGKVDDAGSIYCGPGLWFDPDQERIRCRLAHTRLVALGEDNYRGETDPRRLPLVVAGDRGQSPLAVEGARNLRFQDLVVRGARGPTVAVSGAQRIEFDGMTVYGGSAAFSVRDTYGLRLVHCACRGIAAPWTFRGSLKYRSIEARIFSASGWEPTGIDSRDFELAYCEFTDCVDGVFLGNVRGVWFHHNLVDNVSDDGIFLTAATAYDGTTPGGDVFIHHNRLSRCLTTLAFGVGHGRQKVIAGGKQTGAGVRLFRNVFDYRRPVMYHIPSGPEETQITFLGRVASDHGSPAWEPMDFYHNTFCVGSPPGGNYAAGLAGHLGGGTRRRILNNIFWHFEGVPGAQLPAPPPVAKPTTRAKGDGLDDLLVSPAPSAGGELLSGSLKKIQAKTAPKPAAPAQFEFAAAGNLHWALSFDATKGDAWLNQLRRSPAFGDSQRSQPPGWAADDRCADPRFERTSFSWKEPIEMALRPDSPAIDGGVVIPSDWPDPVRSLDPGRPDLGALPAGAHPWRIGVRGRMTMFGQEVDDPLPPSFAPRPWPPASPSIAARGSPAVIVQGYPAFDAPIVEFILRKEGVPFTSLTRTWLAPRDYSQYGLVVLAGDLARANIEPHVYDSGDLVQVRKYLEEGGRLLLLRGNTAVFGTPEGRTALAELVGTSPALPYEKPAILDPAHPWLKHLNPKRVPGWLNAGSAVPLRASQGERIIGLPQGPVALYRVRVGKGQLLYVGWEIASALPAGRAPATVEQEQAYEEQYRLLANVVRDASVPSTSGQARAGGG